MSKFRLSQEQTKRDWYVTEQFMNQNRYSQITNKQTNKPNTTLNEYEDYYLNVIIMCTVYVCERSTQIYIIHISILCCGAMSVWSLTSHSRRHITGHFFLANWLQGGAKNGAILSQIFWKLHDRIAQKYCKYFLAYLLIIVCFNDVTLMSVFIL